MKIIITEEQLNKLINEDITAGTPIVYHRTPSLKNTNNISKTGFKASGDSDIYGVGVYTTYNLDSQLNDRMLMIYGKYIIESKVLSLNKYLILDEDIAKRIYKSRYKVEDQLNTVLSKKEIFKLKQEDIWDELLGLINKKINFTSKILKELNDKFNDILVRFNGVIYTSPLDGRCLLAYDEKNIEPLRYSVDDGKTWNNIVGKEVYSRSKNYKIPKDTIYNNIFYRIRENINKLTKFDIEYLEESYKDNSRYEDLLKSVFDRKGELIQYLKNPSEKLQVSAVKQNNENIKFIVNPTETVKKLVKK